MSLISVQDYIASECDGLASPVFDTSIALVQPPPFIQLSPIPVVYIWGGKLDEDRMTLPRLRGQKRVAWTIRGWVQWVGDNSIEDQRRFPAFLDALRDHLRAVVIPETLTDPYSGQVSKLLNLGERIIIEYGTPTATSATGMLLHTAAMQLPCAEILNPA